jgi:hypothetical protein
MQGVGTKMGTVFKSLPIEIERPPLNPNSWLSHLPMLFALDVLGEVVAPPNPGTGPLRIFRLPVVEQRGWTSF